MNKYPLIGGSICAVILVILASLTNVVGYQTHTLNSPLDEKSVHIAVIVSKADGASTKSTVTLSHNQYLQLKEELNAVKDPDGHLTVYQKYGVIPKNMTMENLRVGMEKRAQGKQAFLPKLGKNKIILGIFCKVHIQADFILYPFFRKMLIGLINDAIHYLPIPSINFLLFYASVNSLNVNNESYNILIAQFIGFVGFTIAYFSPPDYLVGFESWGYCALCLGE